MRCNGVAIETAGLTRRFSDVTAVDDLHMNVKRGDVFGFLGPNGSGKSTTINMLLGFVPPTSGTATVLGHDIEAESVSLRRQTGVLPEDFGVYKRLSARKHVEFAIACKDATDDADDLLERVGLDDAKQRSAGGFSTGMKQRLALAMALAGEPELLILDEPTSGLDPNGAIELRNIVLEEADRGATVFFSSHSMEQVEAVCDRVGILRDGQLIAQDSIDALKREFDRNARLTVTVDAVSKDAVSEVESIDSVERVHVDGNDVIASIDDSSSKATVISALERAGVSVEDISSREPSLEDLFASLTTSGNSEQQSNEAAAEMMDN